MKIIIYYTAGDSEGFQTFARYTNMTNTGEFIQSCLDRLVYSTIQRIEFIYP